MSMDHYILDENDVPVPIEVWRAATPQEIINGEPMVSGRVIDVAALTRWGTWYEKRDRRIVKQEHVGRSWVSTVFLSLDHSFSIDPDVAEQFGMEVPPHKPILWETMVFGGKMADDQERCGGNRLDAETMHFHMVQKVRLAEGWWVPVCGWYWNNVIPFLDDQIYDWRDWMAFVQWAIRQRTLNKMRAWMRERDGKEET